MRKGVLFYILLFCILLISFPYVLAAETEIIFENVLSGGYAEMDIAYPLTVSDTTMMLSKAGPIKDWIIFDSTSANVDEDGVVHFKVRVMPPIDAPLGWHEGMVVLNYQGGGDGKITSSISSYIPINVKVGITANEIIDLEVHDIKVKDSDEGNLIESTMTFENKGNTEVYPTVSFDILEIGGEKKLTYRENIPILPTATLPVSIFISPKQLFGKYFVTSDQLSTGQYKAVVTVRLDDLLITREKVLFDFFEKGVLREKGEFVEFKSEDRITIGEPIELKAVFSNTGEVPLKARFEGVVSLNGKIIESIQSEDTRVGIGAQGELIVNYQPQEVGRYHIEGHIVYNSKATQTESSFIDVIRDEPVSLSASIPFVLIVLVVVFFILNKKYKILVKPRKRKRYSKMR